MRVYKSKVSELYDYRNIDLSSLMTPFTVNEEEIENEIMRLRKKYSRKEKADVIEKGDIVTLNCSSDLKKFNRDNLSLKAGRGLFDRQFEEMLMGMHVGERRLIRCHDTDIDVEILTLERTVLSDTSDEEIKAWGLDGITTLENLRNDLIRMQHEADTAETVETVSSYVENQVVEHSLFEMDEEEVNEQNAYARVLALEMQKMNGVDSESEEGIEGIENVKKMFLVSLKSAVIGDHLMDLNDVKASEEDYMREIETEMAYSNIEKEEAMKMITREIFEKQFRAGYFLKMIQKYIYELIIEKGY